MTAQRLDFGDADSSIADALQDTASAEQLLALLCQIGPRPAGSDAMRQAAAELSGVWRTLGAVHVHEEPVPVVAWREAPSSVELLTSGRIAYDSLQALNSGSGTVEGPVAVVYDAHERTMDQLGATVRGSVTLTAGHAISGGKYIATQQRVCRLQEAGAAAVILASQHPSLPAIEFMYRSNPVIIPVLNVSGQDARALAQRAATLPSLRARVKTGGQSFPRECINLVGDLGPDVTPDEIVILSAHLDSFHVSPGAFDNLTGVVALTEIVRVLAPFRRSFARRLRVVAFTGEEIGFIGSKHYVKAHSEELDQIRLVLNLDGLFDKTAQGIAVMWAPKMRDYIAAMLAVHHPEVGVRDLFCMSSDYLAFALQGIPVCRPANWEGPYPLSLHTREDTIDRVPIGWIRDNALVLARLLLRLLTDRSAFPQVRRAPEKTLDRLQEEDAGELVLRWKDFAPLEHSGIS